MFNKTEIEKNKSVILPHLYEWADTFLDELDEFGEKTDIPYDTVYLLAERFEKGLCTEEDYENIDFHIYQINYNEIKIKL